jgi:alkanesulfonate monooxygenase SsuD/methylene tetrahydromethanopterin reductase-like flavin-dependent oxidoreductase (luciferase family)
MTTLGAVFLPQLPPERLRSVARAADEAGLDELWLWEDCFWESGIATAAAALGWTERVRVSVGLLPVPLRNVGIAAMEIATLRRLFPDRIAVGVGHGVLDWMGQVGVRAESPMTLLREYLVALGALLRGEKVTTSGRYVNLDAVELVWPPTRPGPLYVGAVGPKTLRLAGELADGVILTGGTTPQKVAEARQLVGDGKTIVVYLHCATGPDAAERLETERVKWAYEEGRDCYAVGDAHAVAEAVRRWAEAGADTVVLQPTPDDPDHEGFMRFAGLEVAPLLR